jgi:predicted nucleic acid-binding protein
VKAVVDTNILISGIFWGGKPGILLGHWRSGNLTMLATVDILEEYLRVIAKVGKHGIDHFLIEFGTCRGVGGIAS